MAAALAVAIIVGFISANSPNPACEYFMPGTLGVVRDFENPTSRNSEMDWPSPNFGISDFRDFGISHRGYQSRAIGLRPGEEAEWGQRNGITPPLQFTHHLASVFPPSLARSHPEYFPLEHGERLHPPKERIFWNPDLGREDVASHAAEQASRFFARNPDAKTFSLGVNDGLLFGESPETTALITPMQWFRGRPDFSRLVFTFMNRAAADLAQTCPDKYLGCLAYYWCENTPPFPVNPQVIPFLTADRSQSYDPAFKRQELELQQRWAEALGVGKAEKQHLKGEVRQSAKGSDFSRSAFQDFSVSPPAGITPRLGLYDYLDGYGFLVPRVPIHAFAEHIRHAHEVGFTDYYGESSLNWGLDGPLPWTIARLLESPEQDVDALLDHYYAADFGPAAGPMRKFFARCEQQWMTQSGPGYWLKYYRNEGQAALFPPEVRTELRTYLDEAAVAARSAARKSETPKIRPAETDSRAAGAPKRTKDTKRSVYMISDGPHFGFSASRLWPMSASPRYGISKQCLVADRVAFVSDSFGVTERFCAFQESRAALAEAVFQNVVTSALLQSYLERRSEFIRYAHVVTDRWPLAFYPINYIDWLRDDPAFAGALALAVRAENLTSRHPGPPKSGSPPVDLGISVSPDCGISERAFAVADALRVHRFHEIPLNGSFEGSMVPGRRVAGLQYGIDLPPPWHSTLEPTEHGMAVLETPKPGAPSRHFDISASQRFLRLTSQEAATVSQWVPAKPGAFYLAAVAARGRVTSSDAIMLTIGFLDAQQKRIGEPLAMRIPVGDWTRWSQLTQGAPAPPNAVWAGIGILCLHQLPGDWADFTNFSLRESD